MTPPNPKNWTTPSTWRRSHVATREAHTVDWSEILYLGRQIRAARKRLSELEGKRAKLLAEVAP